MTDKPQSLFELIQDATQMLLDRSKEERDLIYAVAILDDEARAALILAYGNITRKDD